MSIVARIGALHGRVLSARAFSTSARVYGSAGRMVFEKIDPEARNRYDIGELPPDSKIQRQQTWDFHHQNAYCAYCDHGKQAHKRDDDLTRHMRIHHADAVKAGEEFRIYGSRDGKKCAFVRRQTNLPPYMQCLLCAAWMSPGPAQLSRRDRNELVYDFHCKDERADRLPAGKTWSLKELAELSKTFDERWPYDKQPPKPEPIRRKNRVF